MTHLGGGGIYALSDVGYGPTSILNSQDIQIRNNRISGGGGISYKADGAPGKSATLGGQVQIIGNTVVAPDTTGVHLLGYSDPTVWGNGYIVAENTVVNANNANLASLNTGYGVIKPGGINIDQLQDIVVANNTCIDARVSPQQFYGIQVGQTFGPSSSNQPNRVTLSGNRIFGYQAAKTNLVSTTYTTDFAELTDDHLSVVGNYGFGTASPAYKYHFSGGTLAIDSGSGTDTLRLRDATITKAAGGFFGLGSGLRVSGPLQTPITVKTADYAVSQSDSTIFADATAGLITVTLLSAAGFAGEIFTIKRVSGGANTIVVATTSGQTIDGSNTKTLGTQYAAITVQSDSFNWKIIGQLGTVT